MVQTSIGNTLAFGFPGVHGNGQPWVADCGIATANVTFGTPATQTSTGFAPYDGTTFSGIFVGPHEHVLMKLPDGTASLTVPAGTSVAVAKKGTWFATVTVTADQYPTESSGVITPAVAPLTKGMAVNITAGGLSLGSGTKVAEVVDFVPLEGDYSATDNTVTLLIRLV